MKIKEFLSKKEAIITLIIIVAAVLRLYKLDSIPPHLTPDEASLGYNAYSILKTGKDEYGQFLPFIFKSFGDWKPGLYVYFTIPFVWILGLNELSVRLVGALAGILAIYLVYLIIKKIFKNELLPFVAAILLAVSPWHVYFSRGAWEVNLALTLTLAAIYFFLSGLNKNKEHLIFSAVFFALTLLTYQGAKLSSAIVLVSLVTAYWKDVFAQRKSLVLPLVVGLILSLPVVLSLFNGQSGRLSVFSVFSYSRPKEYLEGILNQGQEKVGDVNYYLFHSESENFTRGILGRYFNHYSGRFLFFEGDWQNPRHSAPNHGILLFLDMFLLVFGIIYTIRSKLTKGTLFMILWFLLASLPAALSRDQVHAVRSLNMVAPLTVINALGVIWVIDFLKANRFLRKWHMAICFLLTIVYFAKYLYFIDAYFIHLPVHNSKYWYYGYREVVNFISPLQKNYQKIVIEESYSQPYIYFLFYQKYDPVSYQKQSELLESEVGDVGKVRKLDNISFEEIDWWKVRNESGTLVVVGTETNPDLPKIDSAKLFKEINFLDGASAFKIFEIK